MSGLLGGGDSGYYQARRGIEKLVFYSTIVLAVAFVALAIYQLYAQTH
jgi:preprotein translocase subunit SecG